MTCIQRRSVFALLTLVGLFAAGSASAQTVTAAGLTLGINCGGVDCATTAPRSYDDATVVHGIDVEQTTGLVFFIAGGGTTINVLDTAAMPMATQIVGSGNGSWGGILSDLTLGPDGTIHVLSTSGAENGNLQRFPQDPTDPPIADLATGLPTGGDAAGIDFNCVGDLFVGERTDSLSRITPAGDVSQVTMAAGWVDIDEIVQSFDNEMFILDGSARAAGHRVVFIVRADGTVDSWATNVGVSNSRIYSAALDRAANALYVGDYQNGTIYRLRDSNGDGFADEEILIATGFGTNTLADLAIGPSSSGGTFSLYATRGAQGIILEFAGLGVPGSTNCGGTIDDDGDGYCETGFDSDGDGDCDVLDTPDGSVDCDDDDAGEAPDLTEVCGDLLDNDCSGALDDSPICSTITGPTGQILPSTATPTGTSNVADGTMVSVTVTGPGSFSETCTATVMSSAWSCAADAITGLTPGTYSTALTVQGVVRDTLGFDVVECLGDGDCDDSNACTTDTCGGNTCTNTAVTAGDAGMCAGAEVCSGAPGNTCGECADTDATGTDAGCTGLSPHCQASGGAASCEPCIDTDGGSGIDLGCGAGTPYCQAGLGGNVCVACVGAGDCGDANDCTDDVCTLGVCTNPPVGAGTVCSGGVCDVTGSPLCEVCVDDGVGIDTGCDASTPFCTGASGARVCVACVVGADCADGNACTDDVCTAGACTNPASSVGTMCSGGVCDGTGADVCETCVDTGAGTDAGCDGATPNCIGASGARSCVECEDASECDDANACTADSCDANACVNASVTAGDAGMCSAGEVCSGGPGDMCVACSDTDAGGTDAGCDGSNPHCVLIGIAAVPTCNPCEDDSAGTDIGCTDAAPNCVLGSGGVNECASCVSNTDCDDGNECTTDTCGSGLCSNTAAAEFTPCTGGVCTAAPSCAPITVDITSPLNNPTLATATPTIEGTATPGATVTVTVDSGTPVVVVADAFGVWTAVTTDTLVDGPHTVTAGVTLGSMDVSDAEDFSTDTATDVSITAPASGSTTLDSTPTIQGTGEPGATVVVSVDGSEVGTTTVDVNGDWTLDTTTPLINGAHSVSVTSTDVAGNVASDAADFTVDSNSEVAIITPVSGSVINDPMPTIAGSAVAGASVTVTIVVDSVETTLGTVTADGDGDWTLPLTSPLADGTYTATATATDLAGNMASDGSTFTVDTMTTIMLTSVDPTGTTISGMGEPGATVEVTIDGTSVGTTTVGTDGTWELTTTPLGEGEHVVVATGTDEAGNTAMDTTTVTVSSMPDMGVVPDGGMVGDSGMSGTPSAGTLSGGALCTAGPSTGGTHPGAFVLLLLGAALVARRRR